MRENERYFKVWEHMKERVQEGKNTVQEIGYYPFLALLAQAHTGYWNGSFSMYAKEAGIPTSAARYLLKKFRTQGLIWFNTSQGEQRFKIFIMGMSMTQINGKERIVTQEHINQITENGDEYLADLYREKP